MSRTELLLVQLDEAYGTDGRWAADYDFPDPVPAPFTTIAWRLLHIADCKIMYHEYAYGAAALTFPDLEAPRTAAGAIDRLREGQQLLRDDLTGLADDSALDAEVGTNWGEQPSCQAEPDHVPGRGRVCRPGGSSGR